MSRQLRDNLPRVKSKLMPEVQEARHLLQSDKERQKSVYDRKASYELPPLDAGDHGLIQADKGSSVWLPRIVVKKVAPRSYQLIVIYQVYYNKPLISCLWICRIKYLIFL